MFTKLYFTKFNFTKLCLTKLCLILKRVTLSLVFVTVFKPIQSNSRFNKLEKQKEKGYFMFRVVLIHSCQFQSHYCPTQCIQLFTASHRAELKVTSLFFPLTDIQTSKDSQTPIKTLKHYQMVMVSLAQRVVRQLNSTN